ncbi:MAG: hypothetical protein R3181_11025, partial [Rubricoccaceae bacterium]|nr:hypothetical protein [Rubricoccaceae bacterium]
MRRFRLRDARGLLLLASLVAVAPPCAAQFITSEPAQLRGLDDDPDTVWSVYPVLTVGEDIDGYRPTGILDGIGIGRVNSHTNRIVVNSELADSLGYAYSLANGTELRGARIHSFDTAARTGGIRRAGLAYDTVYDRYGALVTDATQINEGTSPPAGFAAFCSGT